jgi:hypothetical protein
MGQLPNLVIFGMVANDALTGDRKKNPFRFQHFHIERFNLNVNGSPVPIQPLEFSYGKDSTISMRGYQTLFKGTGIHYSDKGHQITKKLYDDGLFLLCFDLTNDHSYDGICTNMISQGSICAEGRFSQPLKESITCIVYMEFDTIIEIDSNRNIKRTL